MKLWIDDVRPAPEGYVWCKSVYTAITEITRHTHTLLRNTDPIEIIDIDYDAGDYAQYGGDYITILDFLEEYNLNYPIRIHSMNPVGVATKGRGNPVKIIGNIIKDKWFDAETFFADKEENIK